MKRYYICADVQLPDFATLPTRPSFQVQLLPGGGLIVPTPGQIYQLNGEGGHGATRP